MNARDAGEVDDAVELAAISRRRMPRIAPLRKTFSRPVSSGWKPEPTSISAAIRPSIVITPRVGAVMPAEQLEQRALAGAVAADDAERLAAGTSKPTSRSAQNSWSGARRPKVRGLADPGRRRRQTS